MLDTSQGEPTAPASETPIARATAALAPEAAQATAVAAAPAVTVAAAPAVTIAAAPAVTVAAGEGRGCLFALSQPPLMIFLAVVGTLLLLAALHDLYLL